MTIKLLIALALLSITGNVSAAEVPGEEVILHTSPNKIEERCVILAHMPGGKYSSKDSKTEQAYCKVDFYSKFTAMCPRNWSNTPGTMIYQLSAGPYKGNAAKFELSACPKGQSAKNYTTGKQHEFIITMNIQGGNGTFSAAPLLYYHFSRYFDTHIHVPVAVQRSMDKEEHQRRITQRGIELTPKKNPLLVAAWREMNKADKNPAEYKASSAIFTEDHEQVYGVLLRSSGKRYDVLLNGARKSKSALEQYNEYQQTPAFLALRNPSPLKKAIRAGMDDAKKDPLFTEAMKSEISDQQIAYWMQDLTEITLLDYIFSQRDRLGNIHYKDYWYWKKGSKIRKQHARTKTPPRNMAKHKPVRIQETFLNDNDAGGLTTCRNFSQESAILEKIRHFNPDTYKRLIKLDKDFSQEGKLYSYVKENFGLTEEQFQQIVTNTHEAATVLKESCKEKKLRFDLDPDKFFARKSSKNKRLNCNKP